MAGAASASTDGGGRDGQEQEHSSGGLDHREDVASGAKISGKFLKILDGKKTSLRNTLPSRIQHLFHWTWGFSMRPFFR